VPANQPPVLAEIEDKEVEAGTLLSFVVSALDPDGDKVFIKSAKMIDGSPISTIGAELVCSPEGITRFNWTPTDEQAGKKYYVCFQAADDKGAVSESLTVKIYVKEVNNPPIIEHIENRETFINQDLAFYIKASDLDNDNIALSAQLANGEPLSSIGAVFYDLAGGKGRFVWRPDSNQGTAEGKIYHVIFRAVDYHGASTSETTEIKVIIPVPCITEISPASGWPNSSISIYGKNLYSQDVKVKFASEENGETIVSGLWESYFISCKIPQLKAGEYDVTVIANGLESNAQKFTVALEKPRIDSIKQGDNARAYIIEGEFFGEAQNERNRVEINGHFSQKIEGWSKNRIVFSLSDSVQKEGTYYVRVIAAGGISKYKSIYYALPAGIEISHTPIEAIVKGQNLILKVKVANPQNLRYLKVRYRYYREWKPKWRYWSFRWRYWSYGTRYFYNNNPDDKTIYTATIPCSDAIEGKGNVRYYIYGKDKKGKNYRVASVSVNVEAESIKSVFIGDVNLDGKVRSDDAIITLSYIRRRRLQYSQLISIAKNIAFSRMDIDGDGKITHQDENYISRLAVGLSIPFFPAGGSGDINGNGRVGADDRILVMSYMKTGSFNSLQLRNIIPFARKTAFTQMDVNKDGRINSNDVVNILRLAAGLDMLT
jgi:hypothetical protein